MSADNIPDRDERFLNIILTPIRVSAAYRPRLGQGRKGGLDLSDFQVLYRGDPFYSWFGLDSPLMYAAHRAAGGMTSVYRQIGIGCQWLINEVIRDELGLTREESNWSYTIPVASSRDRVLSLDARIPQNAIRTARLAAVTNWLGEASREVQLPAEVGETLKGSVFEVRRGYKSKDSKRQNADVANAANAYAHQYLPVVMILSTQIDSDVAERYRRARWLLLVGSTAGSPLDSTYASSAM